MLCAEKTYASESICMLCSSYKIYNFHPSIYWTFRILEDIIIASAKRGGRHGIKN
jgi:hypothetical protein